MEFKEGTALGRLVARAVHALRDGPAAIVREQRAQGTVEYALTVLAFLAMLIGIAAIWRAGVDGTLARLVREAASHVFGAGGAIDIALY